MFPSRFYPDRMFAPRYFPKVGATLPEQNIGLWHNLSMTSYDTNTVNADTVPQQTRNTDISQVIQAGVDAT
jgi:hypothetical protein